MLENNIAVKISNQTRPVVHHAHNRREVKVVSKEDHIDMTRPYEIILDYKDLESAYEEVFNNSIKNYNKKQARKDRKIKNYLQTILEDERRCNKKESKKDNSRKPVYESIFKIGKTGNQINPEKAKKILKEFVSVYLPSHYPNMKIIGVYMHDDEFSIDEETKEKIPSPPHLHVDWIPVCHCLNEEEQKAEKERRKNLKEEAKRKVILAGKKWTKEDDAKWQKKDWKNDMIKLYGKSQLTGMDLQASLTGALLEMGFKTGREKGWTAQMSFEENVRHSLENFAEQREVLIDRTKSTTHRDHYTTNEYKIWQDNEKKEHRLAKKEREQQAKENLLQEANKKIQQKQIEVEYKEKQNEEFKFQNLFYENVSRDVRQKTMTIDKAEEQFHKTKGELSFDSRFKTFVNSCKEVVIHLVKELNEYKNAFVSFWKATPKNIKDIAVKMEENNCSCFKEFYEKGKRGELLDQLRLRNQNYKNYKMKKKNMEQDSGHSR